MATKLTTRQRTIVIKVIRGIIKGDYELKNVYENANDTLEENGATNDDIKAIQNYLNELYTDLSRLVGEDTGDPGWRL